MNMKVLLLTVFLTFLLVLNTSKAVSLELIENTDKCLYRADIDKDYCYSVYRLKNLSLINTDKLKFYFADRFTKQFKETINGLENVKYQTMKSGKGYIINITAFKNPYKSIDNVLCYNEKCFYEFAWWNTSFNFKYPVNASTSSGTITQMILLNDSLGVDFGDGVQYIWCNYTVSSSRSVVGYLYWMNSTFYNCVDPTETFRVSTMIDEGNGTNYNGPEPNLMAWLTMNNTDDRSIYGIYDITEMGDPTKIQQAVVGQGYDLDGNDHLILANPGDFDESLSTLSAGGWFFIDGGGADQYLFAKEGSWFLRIDGGNTLQFWISSASGGGASQGTAGSYQVGEWVHIYGTYNGSTIKLYINGDLNTTGSASGTVNVNGNAVGIGARATVPDRYLAGDVDNIRFFNRTLSDDEVMALYNNTVGGQNFAPLGPVQERTENTSILAINDDLPDFTFSNTDFEPAEIIFFNTSIASTNLTLISTMNIEKTSMIGSPNIVSVRILLNGSIILEEDVRTVSGLGDVGSVSASPVIFNVPAGEHNITYEFKRTGTGIINVTNFDFNLIQFLSNNNDIIRNQLLNVTFNHSSTDFVTAFNWTFNKSLVNSTIFTMMKQTLMQTAGSSSTSTYFIQNLDNLDNSTIWQRYLMNSADIGSLMGIWTNPNGVGLINYTVQSRQDNMANTITVNASILNFELSDSVGRLINSFKVSNQSTDLTNSVNLNAGFNLLTESNFTTTNGDSVILSFTTTFGTSTGSQTPRYFINTTNSSIDCFTQKSRSLSSNADIGNAFAVTVCDGIPLNETLTYQFWVEVGAGETLVQIDEEFIGMEAQSFNITEGQLPPFPGVITNPTNGSNVSGSDTITWTEFVDPNEDEVTYNITLVNLDGTLNLTIGVTTNRFFAINWAAITLDTYILNVEGCDVVSLCADANITITVTRIPLVDLQPSTSFCENGIVLRTETARRVDNNGVINDTITTERLTCNYGCSNSTLSNFGNPGCEEADFMLYLILIIITIIIVLMIRRNT